MKLACGYLVACPNLLTSAVSVAMKKLSGRPPTMSAVWVELGNEMTASPYTKATNLDARSAGRGQANADKFTAVVSTHCTAGALWKPLSKPGCSRV